MDKLQFEIRHNVGQFLRSKEYPPGEYPYVILGWHNRKPYQAAWCESRTHADVLLGELVKRATDQARRAAREEKTNNQTQSL